MLYIGYLIILDGQSIKKISFGKFLLPSASPPRRESTPVNTHTHTHTQKGKNYINTG